MRRNRNLVRKEARQVADVLRLRPTELPIRLTFRSHLSQVDLVDGLDASPAFSLCTQSLHSHSASSSCCTLRY